ncbi:hypothetical protein GALL_246920 [mine drainage metagenome]|uniref:Polysaccharide biosynthesis protein n=1 Tax=mine drainage metagenome TaxID=410659 RepID=A0A1J5RDE6_9ZZZZ
MEIRKTLLIRDLALVAVATTITNVASYLMSLAGARLLPPPEFGAFGALLGLSIIGSTLAIAAQAVAARRVASTDPAARAGAAASVIRVALAAAGMLMLASLLVSFPLATLLNVSYVAVAATLASVAVLIGGFTALGLIQGRSEHARFGGAYAALGIARAACTIGAIAVHPSAEAAAIGMLAGGTLGSVLAVIVARVPLHIGPRVVGVSGELIRNAIALLGLYAITNLDVVLARSLLPVEASGLYAVGALVAKIAFFLPTFVSYVLFPHMSSTRQSRYRLASVLATLALGVAVTVASAVLAPLFISIAGGNRYAGIESSLWLFALQGSIFAVIQSIIYVRMSTIDRGSSAIMTMGVLAFVLLVALRMHNSVDEIVLTSIAVGLATAGVIWRAEFSSPRPRSSERALR